MLWDNGSIPRRVLKLITRKPISEIRRDPVLLARLQELTIGAKNHSAMLLILESDKDSIAFIAHRDGRPIGWAFYRRSHEAGVYVDPTWRRIGIGTSLLRAVVEYFGPNVTVYPNEDGAVRFFRLLPVRVVDTRENPGAGI